MHELSIAQNIVEIVQKHIPKKEWERVAAVRLKIGMVAGIVPDSLEFSFQAITAETPLRCAHLEIELIPFRVKCNECGATTENEIGFAVCGECGNANTEILSGSELDISEIEVADSQVKIL
jgi:hydrogenase nickel incorporation protein HypA/HybF